MITQIRKRLHRLEKAQSVIEYILVALVFASAGVLTFLGIHKAMFAGKRGTQDDYQSKLIGRVLSDEGANQPLPATWSEGSANAGNIAGENPAWEPSNVVETPEDAIGFTQLLKED